MPRRRPPPKHDPNDLRDLRVGLYCRVSLDKDGTEKSVDDQEAVGREWVERAGARLDERHVYRDADRSASRFATKQRENFDRLLGDIHAGRLDVVWFWELSRSQRRLDVFAKLRDLCRDMGVLWVIRDRAYDPANSADMITLGMLSVIGENESEMTSQRVQRGKKSSAIAGRPAGKIPYGYKRIWNKDTGAWERDVPNFFDGDGLPVEDSPVYVVREIFDRIAAGHSITSIRKDLNARGIRTQQGYPWDNFKVRYIAMSPTYLGQRVYRLDDLDGPRHGERTKAILRGVEARWPPLVDAETFWAVQRILSDPARTTTRFGPRDGTYLLSAIGRCDECGGPLSRKKAPGNKQRQYKWTYSCRNRACVAITLDALDAYVEQVIVRWLSDPDVAADLSRGDDSAAAAQARADAERGRVELRQLYQDVKAGAVSPTIATLDERRLMEAIDDADQRAQAATLPAVLRGKIGPQAKKGWDRLDLEAKRQIIRVVADIRVRRVGRGVRVPIQDRVEWRWLLGPGSERGDAIAQPE